MITERKEGGGEVRQRAATRGALLLTAVMNFIYCLRTVARVADSSNN